MKYEIYKNAEFGEIKTMDINGEPWFVGADVAKALVYSNARDAIFKHVDDEDKDVAKCDTLGGTQKLTVINESGLYSLVLCSKLPTAKRFKHWVTSEVLPAIRKTGGYLADMSLSPTLRWMIEAEQKLNAQQAEITAVGDKVNAIQEAFTVEFDDWRDDVRSMVGKIAMTECGDYSGIESVYQRAYDALEYRAGVCLTARVRNKKNRLLENGATKTAIKAVSVLDIINDDKKLREIFTAILREMLAKEV